MKGPLSYVGGKYRLANEIIKRFPPHKTYVEPFAGGAQVFFRKESSPVEILNDLDGEMVNFYRICQSHHGELIRYMHYMLLSRKWFQHLQKANPENLTDIQRAARYLYLQKVAFGGRVRSQSYGYFVTSANRFSPQKIPDLIEEAHQRLAGAQIECGPYEEILTRYDRPTTLFYLDPPYFGIKLYHHNLEKDDFIVLRDRLMKLKGKFLLSLNDTPEVRRIFSSFHIETVGITYSVQIKGERQHEEVLISNYTSKEEMETGAPGTMPAKGSPQRAPPP
jgi:DNA adenine methylase